MIALVADVHLANHRRLAVPGERDAGLNSRARQVLATLDLAIERAWKAKATDLVLLGDTLDSVRPEPQIVTALQARLRTWTALGRLHRVHLLVGNHERASMADGDHALGPLEAVRNVFVYEKPVWVGIPDGSIALMVPYLPGRIRDWLPAVLEHQVKEMKAEVGPHAGLVLCGHFGIYDAAFPSWARESDGAIYVRELVALCKEHGISHVFAGDWHKRMTWVIDGVTVMQIGALVPTGWDNPGGEGSHYGTLALWRDGAMSWEEMPGPRFVELEAREDGAIVLGNEHCGSPSYVRVRARADKAAGCREYLDKIGIPGEVIAESQVAERAKAATEPKTLTQAIDEFANGQPEVIGRCRRYLGCA